MALADILDAQYWLTEVILTRVFGQRGPDGGTGVLSGWGRVNMLSRNAGL